MKVLIFIGILTVTLSTWAQNTTHDGVYQVLDSEGHIVEFFSELQFEGDNFAEAETITLLFPETLAGESNRIELENIDGTWLGHPDLFESLECQADEVYDFSCFMVFNSENLLKTEKWTAAQNHMTLNAFSGFLNASAAVPEVGAGVLKVNKLKAQQALEAQGFAGEVLEHRLSVVDQFFSEPIGWIRYRKSGVYSLD